MFKETYLANRREWEVARGSGDHIEFVTDVSGSVLAPSMNLIGGYKRIRDRHDKVQNEVIRDWWNEEYVPGYLEWIRNSLLAQQRIGWLRGKEYKLRKTDNDLWVVCYEGEKALQRTRHCHRFILLDILNYKIKL